MIEFSIIHRPEDKELQFVTHYKPNIYFVHQLLNIKSENTLIMQSTYFPLHAFQFRTHDFEIHLH